MAYQPELMRPELQRDNGNRNGLNIQQPGEGNWRDGFFDDPENAVDHSKSFSLGDVLPTAGVGIAQSVQGTGELARGLGDALIHTPLKTSARIVNELSRMGLPGVATIEDIFSGAGKGADKTIDALPDGKNKVTDAVGKGLKTTGKGVSDVAGAVKDWSYDKMSPGAQRALNTPMSEGWDDPAVWVAKGTNLIGSIVPDLAAGSITKKVGEVALKKSLTGALEKKFLTAGLSPEKAAAYASESVSKAMPDLFQAGMVTSATASAQGSEAMNASDAVRNADYSELSKSPKFQQTFYAIDDDPQYAELSDRQKMDMAKERVADEVRAQLATDPQSLVVNALAAKLGDAQLVNLALRGTAKSVASGIARNVAEQAGINAAQASFSRYQENAALRDTAGMDVPEWQGVGDASLEGGLMGGAMGVPFGAIAGLRGKRQAEAGAVARQDASRQAMDEKAQRAREMAQDSPYAKPADPVENYRQQFSGLSRDELLQHYADADLAHENDVDAVYRKHAANGLLKEMDRADKLKGIVGEMQGKPRNEILAEYRELNEKDKRNATEQMRWEAAREVLRPQPEATEQPQPAQDTSAQNTARHPLYDTDNLDVPTFMRDPRFRDFTDEPTEVQQHLTRRNAPTPEELVHEQMAKGDTGPTDYELAERPRLPSPGDIHPGQGYPMPGEVRNMSDEPPAGRGGRYTTTGEVLEQSYEKGRQSASPESVQRKGETFRGEQSYRELPAPEHQGLPRPEEVKPENTETVNTERDTTPEVDEGEQNQSQPGVQEQAKTESPSAVTEKSGEKIDDFGEVIYGAAKHRRAALADELNTDKTAEDYRTQPLSKLFPKPDYEKMAAEGTDNKTLAMLALLRNMIPARPRASHRLNHWAKQVEEVRDTAGQLLDGSLPADKFIDRISQEKGSHYREIVNTWEMLHRLSSSQIEQASGYRVKTHAYSMFGGKEYSPPKVIHSLENEKGRSVLDSEDLNDLHKKAKAYFDQQSASPKSADDKTKLDIYQHKRSGEVFIAYGKNKTVLQRGFKTVAKAREYTKTHRAELLEKLNALREQSREEQRNASNRDRNGPVRRGGEMHTDVNALRNISGSGTGYSEKAASLKRKIAARMNTNDAFAFNRLMDSRFADERERGIAIAERVAATLEPEQNVTPEKFSDAFGFRGVQFGNYVEGPRRQSDLNRAYDSLMDMADVLKVPPKALSLNGRLGLAFGARGKGGKNAAAAHYEPDQVAINLTKGNGAGSLAHEWFHALDNYFGQHDVARDGDVASGDRFMTARDTRGSLYQPEAYPVREEVYDAFMGVVKAVNNSGMRRRSLLLDEVRSKPYWSTDIEMAARAFERYVQDKAKAAGVENDYLVNIRKADDHGSPDTYAYPTEAELDGGIRQAFDKLFSTLKTRETDKGVAFYSRDGLERTPEGNVISQTGHSADTPAQGSTVRKVKTVARTVMDRIRDNDLNVRVVKSQAEAAELAGESLDKHGKVHAFYRPDEHEIVLVADNLPDGRTVREKLRHEIIHHAMENVVTPAEYKTIVDNVLKTRDSNNATIKDIWRKVDASYGEELPQVQAGEFLAHIAEKHTPGKLGAAWNRVVSLVKAVLRRTGLLQPSDLNDIGYIRDTIRTLGQRVREGYVPRDGGEVSYSRTGKPDPFKADSYDARQFAEEVRHVATLDKDPRRDIRMGDTPAVLRALGAPNRELIMPGHVVHKATRPEIKDHHVSVETMAELPHLLADPVAIVTSRTEPDALVTLIKAKDKKGAPVVVAVHMHAKGVFVEVNKIASVYGKDNRQALQEQLDNDLLYINKEKAADWLHSARLQLPAENTINGSSGTKVLQPDDIRKGPYYSRSRSALSPEETLAARFVRQMQDKFQVLKAVQDKIRESGGKLDDSNDAYLAEELFHGKAENDLNVMKERYVKPLAKLLADYDIPQSALDEYLYARHAPERNAHIAKINPKMPDGGSGMTSAEAADIMDRVRRSGKQAQYDRLAGIVDDMLARRRELIKTAGLEKEGVVDAWQNAYKHYVPLKGQDADGTVPRTGRGYVISGKESKMAMGRNSRAQSPSTQAIQDLTESLIRNRKNEVGNAFLKLVQDNPDKDYWQVFTDDKPDTTRRVVEINDPETGETIRQVEEMPVPMAMMSDRYFTTKEDGKTYYIKLHDERLMRAMKNMGPETGNVVIQTLARVNRFMSAMNTSLNPEFLVSNFVRDMQTAVMNLKAEQGRDDGKLNGRDIAMKTVRDSGIAMKAIYASLRGKSLTGKGADWQKTWKEFVEDGAKTGWFRMDDLNGQMKEMDHLVSLAKGGWKGQGIQSWHSFTKLVEDANNAVENALRLSAYKHARDAGISRAQAASLAKNMTVNFNRRGEQGVLLNSLYMFANASIQGTANMMRSLAHLNGDGPLLQRLRWSNLNMAQKMALTAVGAGYLLGSLNRAGAGQDEDSVNWYDKVPDYVKEHNLVIMKSLFGGKAGEYWSIPLPYGYNMFYLLGSTAEGVTRGNLTASKAAGNIVGGMLGAFNPLGSEDSKTLTGTLFKNAAPTILRPVADLWANESFMGTPIYQENFPTGTPKPESTLGRRSTPEAYKAFANWLNTSTGGSQYRSGALDIHPDKMKYWIDYVSGGMGRFAGKTIDAAAKTYNGIDIPPQQIPFLGKISGKVMPYADQQAMYDHIDELRQYNAELKSLSGADRAAFRNKYSGQLSMNGIIHQSEIQLKNLRKQRDEVYSDPTLTARQQADRVLMIEQNMKKVVDSFNQEYREMTGE
ncbi:LPD38 domain-containing protein [Salmonella enterica subsp. enterica serovar Corvallis]|nr:LPD5 domain-containing protein [Salmonella enterica]MDJ5157216.1 LPD5 domain-containing protein [Salmonella enterica]